MRKLNFRHVVIDPDPPGSHHDITLIGDIDGDGRSDIVIGGKEGDVNLFWYQNPTWKRYDIAAAPELEAGGLLIDITGNGRLDIVAGQQWKGTELYWFENPTDPRRPWTKRLIDNRFRKYHDQIAMDVDGDGELEILALSQKAGVLVCYHIPDDPTVEPWPESCSHIIARDMHEVEGLAVGDIDGDGKRELIAGPNVFRPLDGWARQPFCEGFEKTRVQVGDIDGDGLMEIVIAEGESHPGRLAICHLPDLEPKILREDLFHPHSLELADFTGSGTLDIFVAEMGLGKNANPRMFVYLNRGDGTFDEVLIQEGIPTHEAKLGDLTGNGLPDIVGKPYEPERHIDVWFNLGVR